MRLIITQAEMREWAQEAVDARFEKSPGKVTDVKPTGAGLGAVGFEISLEPGGEPAGWVEGDPTPA